MASVCWLQSVCDSCEFNNSANIYFPLDGHKRNISKMMLVLNSISKKLCTPQENMKMHKARLWGYIKWHKFGGNNAIGCSWSESLQAALCLCLRLVSAVIQGVMSTLTPTAPVETGVLHKLLLFAWRMCVWEIFPCFHGVCVIDRSNPQWDYVKQTAGPIKRNSYKGRGIENY